MWYIVIIPLRICLHCTNVCVKTCKYTWKCRNICRNINQYCNNVCLKCMCLTDSWCYCFNIGWTGSVYISWFWRRETSFVCQSRWDPYFRQQWYNRTNQIVISSKIRERISEFAPVIVIKTVSCFQFSYKSLYSQSPSIPRHQEVACSFVVTFLLVNAQTK